MPFRQVVRDDAEEVWRQQIQNLITQSLYNTLDFFQLLSRILRVNKSDSLYYTLLPVMLHPHGIYVLIIRM